MFDPVCELANMMQNLSSVQKLTRHGFSAIVRSTRSRGACGDLAAFDCLTASGALIANGGISSPVFRSRCKIQSLRECAWLRQRIQQMQVSAVLTYSEFETEYRNRGSANPSCVFDIVLAHGELTAPITWLWVRERIITKSFEQLQVDFSSAVGHPTG
jgi:hypothetical protein